MVRDAREGFTDKIADVAGRARYLAACAGCQPAQTLFKIADQVFDGGNFFGGGGFCRTCRYTRSLSCCSRNPPMANVNPAPMVPNCRRLAKIVTRATQNRTASWASTKLFDLLGVTMFCRRPTGCPRMGQVRGATWRH